ncbi:cobalt-precorrin-8X methylmutase [Loigolactobacillus coryniformis subsp. coryniformis KCTC 3167 = DSM 20001]|uniref:Cobalt-precorrin-8X methylmutase n=1 Tax=Loigolactobacillus coryniformis subsp. coryniformis KCTC 3167 = DSM 20001 TaxID=913848 RepID=A0A0R1FBG6_9LACO|nr:cobalt-precorrin-8X methylmutase [Loigolactobacillus coryniformis subsp. coryniformis KCTC 3167 = DSM 20001]
MKYKEEFPLAEYITTPNLITEKSFRMIHEEIAATRPDYKFNDPVEKAIITRAIHTTADFEYLDSLTFTHDVIRQIKDVMTQGGTIYTDTHMALSGINKRKLDELGCHYHCYVSDPEIFTYAKAHDITRSMASIEVAAQGDTKKLFVVGNAPTALYKILEMQAAGQLHADAVIGVPVGFVEAKESKEALFESDIPAIVAHGRKGGSNLAAALTNAVLYNLDQIAGD